MRRRVYLIGALAWVLAIPLPPARAELPLTQRYLDIYLKINDAEHLQKQGDYRGALDDFQDCYDKLAKIHEEDPDWESALVVARMEDCKKMIDDLTPLAATQDVTPTPEPNATATPPDENSDDISALKKKLQDVERELQEAQDNLKDSRSEVEAYRAQIQTVNSELVALKNQHSENDKVAKLLNDNKELSDKLAAAQKQIDSFKSPNSKSKLSLVQAQLKNLQDQFDASQEANKSLQQTITTLQGQLDQAQADLVTDNQKLADAGTSSPEYQTVKRENELMRDILTREIQEQAHRDEAKRLIQEEFDRLQLKSKVLQENLDIVATPMTPPTTDEERTLLASLKAPGPEVTSPSDGNVLSTPANGGPSTTDTSTNGAPTVASIPDNGMAQTTPTPAGAGSTTNVVTDPSPPSVPAPTDNSTNQPPVTIASNNPTPSPDPSTSPGNTAPVDPNTTPAISTPPLAPTPTPDPASTVPAATPAPTPPDTTTPSVNSAPTPSPAPDVSTTATTPPVDTPTPSPATDVSSTNPSDPNTQTTSVLPPTTTTVTTTTIQNNNTEKQPDPTQYSVKPRLPDDMRDTAQEAADLFKMQRYDEAAAKYQSIIDKYPESLYAWSNLGVVRFQQNDLPDALKALQQAVKLSPTDAFSYSNLGIVYYQMGQYENAIDALNSAKALDPGDAKTRNYLGCAESQKGWQEVAEKEFRKAIEIDPGFGDAHFNLALVYATSKPPSIELARREYDRALELGISKDARLEKLLQPQP